MPFGDCVVSAAFVKDVGAGQCFGSRRCHPMEVLFCPITIAWFAQLVVSALGSVASLGLSADVLLC